MSENFTRADVPALKACVRIDEYREGGYLSITGITESGGRISKYVDDEAAYRTAMSGSDVQTTRAPWDRPKYLLEDRS